MRQWFDDTAELTWTGRVVVRSAIVLYALVIGLLCFLPQPFLIEGVTTPNIIFWGRLRFLLVPFNSLLSLSQLESWQEVCWVFAQNISNIGLLFPAVFLLHLLSQRWRSFQKSLLLGFQLSLSIEITQLVLDWLIDANRVFEIDDLWTNSLGAGLAYLAYQYLLIRLKTSRNR